MTDQRFEQQHPRGKDGRWKAKQPAARPAAGPSPGLAFGAKEQNGAYAEIMAAEDQWQQETERYRAMIEPAVLEPDELSAAIDHAKARIEEGVISLGEAKSLASKAHADDVWSALVAAYERLFGGMDGHQQPSDAASSRRSAIDRAAGECQSGCPVGRLIMRSAMPVLRAAAEAGDLSRRRCQRIIDRAADAAFEDKNLTSRLDRIFSDH